MDYTNNPIPNLTPPTSTVPPRNHSKARWIIIFVACLIILVAVVSIFKKQMTSVAPVPEVTEEEKLIDSMTGKGKSNLTAEEQRKLESVMTAKGSSKGVDKNILEIEKSMSAK